MWRRQHMRVAAWTRNWFARCFKDKRAYDIGQSVELGRLLFLTQAEDGIRDWSVTGVQTCALPIQAEDGIRDWSVTGVQTCALPICPFRRGRPAAVRARLSPSTRTRTSHERFRKQLL